MVRAPLTTDHDQAVAKAHLRMRQLPIGAEDDHCRLEAEGGLQPAQGRLGIAVTGTGRQAGAFILVHDDAPCYSSRRVRIERPLALAISASETSLTCWSKFQTWPSR